MHEHPSAHPVDELIRQAIQTGRTVSSEDLQRVRERIAMAPFDRAVVRVPVRQRGLAHLGQSLGTPAPSLVLHLVKRVAVDRQWTADTTSARYLADLRSAAGDRAARVLAYRRGDHYAATVTTTERVLPLERRGTDWLPHLLVVYSADRGMIQTGYQFSDVDQLNLPAEVRWLA